MSERPLIIVEAVFEGPRRYKDDSAKLSFVTNKELTTEEFSELDAVRKRAGHVLFSANPYTPESMIPTGDVQAGHKSASQRLRGTLWHVWNSSTDKSMTAEQHYAATMEKIIRHYQESLD